MALSSAKHEKFYETSGSGADKVSTKNLTDVTAAWATEKTEGCAKYIADPILGPIVYQLQQMQDELDYLRTEIALNKDKTGITSDQASAITANTAKTVITSSQASAITANTAKTSMSLGTSSSTALAGDTKLVGIGSNTTLSFGDLTVSRGTYSITLTAVEGRTSKSITLTLT